MSIKMRNLDLQRNLNKYNNNRVFFFRSQINNRILMERLLSLIEI